MASAPNSRTVCPEWRDQAIDATRLPAFLVAGCLKAERHC